MATVKALPEAFIAERKRVRELLKFYEKIGPAGIFGATGDVVPYAPEYTCCFVTSQ